MIRTPGIRSKVAVVSFHVGALTLEPAADPDGNGRDEDGYDDEENHGAHHPTEALPPPPQNGHWENAAAIAATGGRSTRLLSN